MKRPVFIGVALATMAGAAAGSGCFDLIDVEVRASEVCLTGVIIEVPGGAREAVEASHVQEEPAAELPDALDARADLIGVGVSAVSGIDDFGFLRSARIDLDAAELPAITVVDIGEEQSGVLEGVDRWFLESGDGVDLIDYLLAPELAFDLELEGELPERDWAVEIDVCVAGSARYGAGF